MPNPTLQIDYSQKSPAEIARLLSALLSVKRTLLEDHGLNIRVAPKTRKVALNTSPHEK